MLESPVDLIEATVQLEQTLPASGRTVGTGFLMSATNADGSPRTILITANHVFESMKGVQVQVGYRTANPDGSWNYTPTALRIRDDAGAALWTRHPRQDVAAITLQAPPEFAQAAIPVGYLAPEPDGSGARMSPGDELLVLGFPRGVAANNAGFPILRSGRVASYPVSPDASPTFLLDFAVFAGNSGGPVFRTSELRLASNRPARPFIAGILTQQVQLKEERLEIGIVTHARYIAETIDLLYGGRRPVVAAAPWPEPAPEPAPAVPAPVARPAADSQPPPSTWDRSVAFFRRAVFSVRRLAALNLRAFAEHLVAWVDPEGPARPASANRAAA